MPKGTKGHRRKSSDPTDAGHHCPLCLKPVPAQRGKELADRLELASLYPFSEEHLAERLKDLAARERGGRPPKRRDSGSPAKVSLGLKVTPETKKRLDIASRNSGRTQSQEAEFRIELSFNRQDLLTDALSLAYGKHLAGILMMVGLVMADVGEFTHILEHRNEEQSPPDDCWTSDSCARNAAIEAAHEVLLSLTVESSREPNMLPLRGAWAMIDAVRGKARNRFSEAAESISALLGPVERTLDQSPQREAMHATAKIAFEVQRQRLLNEKLGEVVTDSSRALDVLIRSLADLTIVTIRWAHQERSSPKSLLGLLDKLIAILSEHFPSTEEKSSKP